MTDDVKEINIRTLTGLAAFGLLLIVVNLAVTLWVLDRNGFLEKREIVSIDAANMVMGFVAAQDPNVSEAVLERRIRALNEGLDGAIRTFAADRNVIVVNSAAVLGGTRDVTPDMLAALGLSQ